MNKFKKPYGARTSGSRPESRGGARPPSHSRFGAHASARPGFGARSPRSEAFQKFDATCSNCGKKCQVPFRPDGTKPVYCKDCFGVPREAPKGKGSSTASTPRFADGATGTSPAGGKSIADLTRQIAAMNTKIDTMLKLLQNDSAGEE
jgi:CxxC-x17-CxxC domain-containing protein